MPYDKALTWTYLEVPEVEIWNIHIAGSETAARLVIIRADEWKPANVDMQEASLETSQLMPLRGKTASYVAGL